MKTEKATYEITDIHPHDGYFGYNFIGGRGIWLDGGRSWEDGWYTGIFRFTSGATHTFFKVKIKRIGKPTLDEILGL